MPDPIHHTILLADIAGFGGRDDVVQTVMRRQLYDVILQTLEAAGVQRTELRLEDRGDAVLVLVSPTVAKAALLRAALAEIPARLHDYNRLAASSARVRLRVVLAAGEVALHRIPDAVEGAVGHDLNQAFRLLDAEPLRQALRDSGADVLLCVSDGVYQGVARHSPTGVRGEQFHRVTVEGKEGPLTAWLHSATAGSAAGSSAGAEPGTAGAAVSADAASGPAGAGPGGGGGVGFAGGQVLGDQYGMAGGTVGGDFVMGDKHPGRPGVDRRQGPGGPR
jgi:hypothetical protein